MADTVLVTGALGLVGSHTVAKLAADGCRVVATDLDTPANRTAAAGLQKQAKIEVHWADLTDQAATEAMVRTVRPHAIVHLAAIIPPFCYGSRTLARSVNVTATRGLIEAAETLASSTRFVQASSVAVYGSRNPFRCKSLLNASTSCAPADIYGAHKVEAEESAKASSLDWLVLRLGGVIPARPKLSTDLQLLEFDTLLPKDGRVQMVDVEEVASAFAAATRVDASRETLLIGGDTSYRLTQGQVTADMMDALGVDGALPPGRPGDPDDDTAWFTTDWMDTTRSQELLNYQRRSWPDLLAECRDYVGWRRPLLQAAKPFLKIVFQRRWARRHESSGRFADPWGAVDRRWGEHRPEHAGP